ncbi:hypothetical protein EJF36_16730 [Bacillus sp. HMF5848]|uniref:hypothetical protein n=1 Tax=Bacillus sp. HMF5848 TaxID=2495421 RepID=UPI000F7808D8|nr:hypothetical protein [Bacillus sp. HMF5848]RSK28377.1 hypothetical protein EJF36_16730 [Bacillus sp. HMF5848]
MTNDLISNIFFEWEHPFYKILELTDSTVELKVYSAYTDYSSIVTLHFTSEEDLRHQITLQLIKLRSVEMSQFEQRFIDE